MSCLKEITLIKHGFTTVNAPFMPEEAKALTEGLFPSQQFPSQALPPLKWLPIGWEWGRGVSGALAKTQQREPEKKLSLEIQRWLAILHLVPCCTSSQLKERQKPARQLHLSPKNTPELSAWPVTGQNSLLEAEKNTL